jgi:hypothetical protein
LFLKIKKKPNFNWEIIFFWKWKYLVLI